MSRRNHHYQERVNRVLDYIGRHLEEDLSLTRLSAISCFSPFHFHRIFQAVTGETLNSYVRRARLERAVAIMKASPRKRATDIALEAGFAGTAEFSRVFRNHFDRTASSWDRHSPLEKSKICKAPGVLTFYPMEELESWKAVNKVRVAMNPLGAFRYVYFRVFEPFRSNGVAEAYRALMSWLAECGTDFRDVVFIGMSLDDPSVTPAANCRYDLGIAFPQQPGRGDVMQKILQSRGRVKPVPPPTPAECRRANFSVRDFDSQDAGSIHCAGDIGHVARAWQYLYRVWLPAGVFEPADLPAMEFFIQIPEEIGWEKFNLQISIPVVRL
jgi:AraC family transcriptional regulator